MAANDYQFISHWRVPGRIEDVAAILGDPLDLPRWWPSVYLDVRELAPGDAEGRGRIVDLYTKGWLPYTLRWRFRVTELDLPHRIALEAGGDFVGRGVWTLEQDGATAHAIYDWRLRAEKPLLRRLSFLMKPLFAANHRWAMAQGERSLRLELARRAAADAERAQLPLPPGPRSARPLLLGAVGLAAGVGLLLFGRRARR
ncbi:MAG TPA: SRPBCC family protein [Dehalococcoidia bacterium]|nr:SRPBCC family protein [Dehalococcoidia bacterium]